MHCLYEPVCFPVLTGFGKKYLSRLYYCGIFYFFLSPQINTASAETAILLSEEKQRHISDC
jgi:hypothetical protein